MTHSMTWADFYLICFAVGFCFSFFSFVFGGARTGRPHLHGRVGGAHGASGATGTGHGPTGAAQPHGAVARGRRHDTPAFRPSISSRSRPFWHGSAGTGYLLTRYSGVWVGFGLLASVAAAWLERHCVSVFEPSADVG